MTRALIYHDVLAGHQPDDVGFPGPLAARYKLQLEHFDEHLDAIADTGATVGLVTADDRVDCALTFDDGGASALEAAQALERRGWLGHFFVTTGRIGTPGFLDVDGVCELARRGHVVGSHSHSHPTYMGRLSADAICDEWRRSREALAMILGELPATASIPGGFLSRAVVQEAAHAGYRLLMTSEPTARQVRHGELSVLGRYTVWSTTPARQAAGYARGSRLAHARLWTEWNAKGALKRIDPRVYQALRHLRATRR